MQEDGHGWPSGTRGGTHRTQAAVTEGAAVGDGGDCGDGTERPETPAAQRFVAWIWG